MGSKTSKIATQEATLHLIAGPIALIFSFIINSIFYGFGSPPTGGALIAGGLALFIINYLIGIYWTVPRALKKACDQETTMNKRLQYSLWPAFMSLIGDPNVVMMLAYGTPLILIAPLIVALLPPGPLSIGLLMIVAKILGGIPIIGMLLERTLVGVFNLITGSWLFFTFMFFIGYNFWSWLGGSISATHAINDICPEDKK